MFVIILIVFLCFVHELCSLQYLNCVNYINLITCKVYILTYIFLFLRLYLFIFREREKEGERNREKQHQLVSSLTSPTRTWPQPRYVLWLGIKVATFWFAGQCPPTKLHQSEPDTCVFYPPTTLGRIFNG